MVVKEQLLRLSPDIVIVQETNREIFDVRMVARVWGVRYKEWVYAPSRGSSGGIVVTWDSQSISNFDFRLGNSRFLLKFWTTWGEGELVALWQLWALPN